MNGYVKYMSAEVSWALGEILKEAKVVLGLPCQADHIPSQIRRQGEAGAVPPWLRGAKKVSMARTSAMK